MCTNNISQSTYKLWQNGLGTKNKLSKFLDESENCSVCNEEAESPLHLFWYCKRTREVYNMLQNKLQERQIAWTIKADEAIIGATRGQIKTTKERNFVLMKTRHEIWKNRNRKKFENKENNMTYWNSILLSILQQHGPLE